MESVTRRTFIKNALFGAGVVALSRVDSFALSCVFDNTKTRPFEMLAIGDSVMWGQGLPYQHKFSFRTKHWLESEIFENKRAVNLFVGAHSGATIELNDEEGFDPLKTYNGEINIYTPSIKQQVDDAFNWYKNGIIPKGYEESIPEQSGKRLPESLECYGGSPVLPENVDLILVNGGINDLGAKNLVNPTFSRDKIKKRAKEYCGDSMETLLGKISGEFPNARIIVTGYFPLISKETNPNVVYDAIVDIFGESSRTEFLKKIGKKASLPKIKWIHPFRNYLAKHSSVWVDESNKNLQISVNKINNLYPFKEISGKPNQRVFFAKPYFEKENAYGAKESFLWELIDKTKTNDPLYEVRTGICKDTKLDGLNKPERFICQRAGLFHPNIKGADSYFLSIKNELNKFIKEES